MMGRAAASARSELAGPSIRSAWMRAGLLAIIVTALVLVISPGVPRASGTFAPTISIETSTTRASAHPDARITIDNTASDENITSMTMSLPDNFWGSLGAVPEKCLQADVYDTIPHCPADTKVGTVTASAKIEDPDTGTMVNGVLEGDVYLSEAFNPDDPAGVAIIVDAKVGGVDLGKVLVTGRAVMRSVVPDGWDPGASPQIRGLDTIVEYVPSSVYDAVNNRSVSYKVQTLKIDLTSELKDASQPNYLPPLLTNPTICGSYELKATMTSEESSTATPSAPYVVDGCDTVRFDPNITTTFSGGASIAAGTPIGMETNVTMPTASGQPNSNGSIKRVKLRLPRGIGANTSAFGDTSDRCNGGALKSDDTDPLNPIYYFLPDSCNSSGPITDLPQAIIGEATIQTPLLPADEPLHAHVYMINKVPIPALAIVVSDTIEGNPKGVNTSFAAWPETKLIDPGCGNCGSGIVADFAALPDVPVDSIKIDLNRPDRNDPTPSDHPVTSKFLAQASAGDTDCQKADDFAFDVWSQTTTASFPSVTSIPTSGCTSIQKFTPTTGPWGSTTTNPSPTFGFTYAGATANLLCAIDAFSGHGVGCPAGSSPTGTTGSISGSSLAPGTHAVFANADTDANVSNGGLVRYTGVRETHVYDDTVPTTTLTAGPGYSGGTGTSSSSRPSFTFNASESSAFQCSLDNGAFLPCGEATGTASAPDYQLPVDEYLEASDVVHTFEVRAQDAAGNVDLTPASASFKVEKTFDPQVSVSLTTTVARAHPEMTVTINNDSHEDIKDLNLNMPDGFFGGLTGVVGLCSLTDAAAGTCGSGSQIGTVDTTAVIDRSTASISGKVYLTDPQPANVGDPAGLTIVVKPKIQEVTFNPIILNARLMVRGEAEGINTATLNIPNTATSTVGEVSSFDLRTMVLKLNNNNAAPQKLLTNPSSCGTKSFPTSFKGQDDTTATEAPTANFTGCENLSFGPALSLSLADHKTHLPPKATTPRDPVSADLSATLTADPNSAGIRNADILMPPGLTINPQKVPFVCQDAQYPDNCPQTSYIGTVEAISPLLPEALKGNVYMLKGTGLPRIFVRLRGRINVNLIATNKFAGPAVNQLNTTFTNLPDVPLSTFKMDIFEFLSTRSETCSYDPASWFSKSALTAWNGSSSAITSGLRYDCPNELNSIIDTLSFKPKKAKSKLDFTVVPRSGTKLKKVTVKLPSGVKFVKSAFSKKNIAKRVSVFINGGSKKLKTKCFKLKSTSTFEIGFCKVLADDVTVSFKAGSITTKSSKKSIKLKITTVDSSNQTQTAKVVK